MKIKIANLVILLVTLFGSLLAISVMPDEVPVHFNIHGVADRWGSKYEMLIMIPIMAIMQLIWFICDYHYRKQVKNAPEEKVRAEAESNLKVIGITFTATSVLFMILTVIIFAMSFSQLDGSSVSGLDIYKIMAVCMGVFLIVTGNYMPKAKGNRLIGFRIAWTLYNDITWSKSNRMGGLVMVITGIITALGGLILDGMMAMIVMLLVTALSIVVIVAYSYKIYRDEIARESEK